MPLLFENFKTLGIESIACSGLLRQPPSIGYCYRLRVLRMRNLGFHGFAFGLMDVWTKPCAFHGWMASQTPATGRAQLSVNRGNV